MTHNEQIQRIAAGLRECTEQPDALVAVDGVMFQYTHALGILVLESGITLNPTTDSGVDFIPLWREAGGFAHTETARFNRGYSEYAP